MHVLLSDRGRALVALLLTQLTFATTIGMHAAWVAVVGRGPGWGGSFLLVVGAIVVVVVINAAIARLAPPRALSYVLPTVLLGVPHVPDVLLDGLHALGGAGALRPEGLDERTPEGPLELISGQVDVRRTTWEHWKGSGKSPGGSFAVAPLLGDDGAVHAWACGGDPDDLAGMKVPISAWLERAPDPHHLQMIDAARRPGEPATGCVVARTPSGDAFKSILPWMLLATCDLWPLLATARTLARPPLRG